MKNFFLVFGALASWTHIGDTARILTVMSVHAPSHHIWFSSLPVALAEKGHDVYAVDIKMPKKLPATLNVSLLTPPDKVAQKDMAHILQVFQKGTISQKFSLFAQQSVETCEQTLSDKALQELINPNFELKFDVIVLNYAWHECLFGLIHRFNNTPTIVASPFPLPVPILRLLGNPIFHAIPHYFKSFPVPMNFLDRLSALALYMYDEYMYYFHEEPAMERVMRKYFGEDTPPVRELSKHIALGFVNMVETKPRIPLVASIVPVGGMHIPPVQPLNKDLKDFLDGAKDGAVIMSFGSLVRGDGIGADKLETVLKVFSRLPQRLVWKYESAGDEKFANVPPNIMLLPWLPQNDLLAHPNVRLFISHCGGLSSQEAAFHGIPILGTPFMVDQFANVEQVVKTGMGLRLPLAELTEETFYGNVTELLNNPTYYETAQRTKSVMQDHLATPMDRAIFNVEYVIRHRGALHLRSPLADLPYNSLTLYVDLAIAVTALILIFSACVLLLVKVVRLLKRITRTKVPASKKID